MNQYKPDYVYPPSDTILAEMKEHGWGIMELCMRSNIDLDTMFNVIAYHEPITETIARGLEHAFGVSYQFWLNLDRAYINAN